MLTAFLERLVETAVHSLTVHLAGTFTPTNEMRHDATRATVLTAAPHPQEVGLTSRAGNKPSKGRAERRARGENPDGKARS